MKLAAVRGALVVCALVVGMVAPAWGAQGQVVSDEVAARALAEAARYVDVTYQAAGERMQGVAYKWGGRSSVDEYLAAVAEGAVPGRDVGADASAVVVNAYRAASPGHRFTVVWSGQSRSVVDATSADLYRWNVRRIEVEALRPGDLLFFHDGSGNVSGVSIFERREGPNVHFIVASANSGKVIRTFLNVNNEYWRSRFLAAGQLLASAQ